MVNVAAVQPWSYGCTWVLFISVLYWESVMRKGALVVDLDEGIANRLVFFKSVVLVAMPLKICQVTTSVLRFDLSKKLNIPIQWPSGVIRSVSFIKTLTCFQ